MPVARSSRQERDREREREGRDLPSMGGIASTCEICLLCVTSRDDPFIIMSIVVVSVVSVGYSPDPLRLRVIYAAMFDQVRTFC